MSSGSNGRDRERAGLRFAALSLSLSLSPRTPSPTLCTPPSSNARPFVRRDCGRHVHANKTPVFRAYLGPRVIARDIVACRRAALSRQSAIGKQTIVPTQPTSRKRERNKGRTGRPIAASVHCTDAHLQPATGGWLSAHRSCIFPGEPRPCR